MDPTHSAPAGAVRNVPAPDRYWPGRILYGDSLLDVDYRHVFAAMPKTALGLMTVFRNENRYDASNVLFRNGRLVKYSKTEITPDMMHIDYGLSLLRSAAIERIPANQQFDLAELYSQLSTAGEIVGIEIFKRFHEIGNPIRTCAKRKISCVGPRGSVQEQTFTVN